MNISALPIHQKYYKGGTCKNGKLAQCPMHILFVCQFVPELPESLL